ncbi:MAG: hypothetical protein C0410_11595 [Anaerolinea sp.]|nr:hypothetical protein [Anaerolinea sp.]
MKSMARKVFYALILFCLASELFNSPPVQADNSIVLTALGTPYHQDFDSLSNTIESEMLPIGWVLTETGNSNYVNNRYQPSTGNFSYGDTFSFGSANSTDRALGGIQDDNLTPLFGASFVNYAGGTINSLSIAYIGEEWRLGNAGGRSDKIRFELSTDATALNNGTWIEYEDLTFFTPNKLTFGIKDGNLAVNQSKKQYTISGLNISAGGSFWIRWSDYNPNGSDDGLAVDDFLLTPFGSDNSPNLTSIIPADNTTNVALDTKLSITFSEPVNLSDGWITLSCSNSQQHSVSVSGGPQSFIVDPVLEFVNGDSCTITIEATKINDQDTSDPPDALDRNYTFNFSTIPPLDNPPIVTNTSPANNASEVWLNSSLTINFSESVAVKPDWFTLDCTKSGTHSATVDTKSSVFILSPLKPFQYDESCTLTINAQNITDLDSDDPPDGMPSDVSITFFTLATQETAPYISSSIPANNATSIPVKQDIELTFNEPVAIDSGTIKINCDSKESFTLNISGGPTAFQVLPDHNFNFGDHCSVIVSATGVRDQDLNDPPDTMIMDQTINFDTVINPEIAPDIFQIIPDNGARDVDIDSNITITFNEEISPTDPWALLECTVSGEHSFTTKGTSLSKEINPDTDFAAGESCTLTILGTQIHDLDIIDPPDEMAENYSITFMTASPTDSAPFVIESYPSDKAVDVPKSVVMNITFSEPVKLLGGWANLSCSKSNKQIIGTEEGPIKFWFAIEGYLDYSEDCTVTLKADKILDLDENDPPDFMGADYSFSFKTEKSPDEISYPEIVNDEHTFPQDGDYLYASFFHLLIQFSKDVLHDGSSEAADNVNNYCLIERGTNQTFETTSCDTLGGDDARISIERITYDAQKYQSDLIVNHAANLPDGTYQLIVSGEHSIKDSFGNLLNNGADSSITFTILNQEEAAKPPESGTGSGETSPQGVNSNSSNVELLIPVTGFRRGEITLLTPQLNTYTNLDDLRLEIPTLDLKTVITGVPKKNGNWDVTWLGGQVGWLGGSALPGLAGNSVLTAHVWDALNRPGPFYGLEKLDYGDQVIVHAWGEEYVYEVREVLSVKPENVNAMLKHQEKAWLTLVTCQGYDEESGEYQHRVLVRAVLMEVR